MSASEMLSYLRSLGIDLWVEGVDLRYSAPKGVLTQVLRENIVTLKGEILALLQNTDGAVSDRDALSKAHAERQDKALPLSTSQEQLWFFTQLAPENSSYNIPAAVRVYGRLSYAALEQSLDEMSRRHESLRTVFPSKGGLPYQMILNELDLHIVGVELTALCKRARDEHVLYLIAEESRRHFKISTAPLWRALLLRDCEDEHVLLLTFHHIICDGWSLGVFVRELISYYEAFVGGRQPALPAIKAQFVNFASWQRQRLCSEAMKEQLSYWEKQFVGSRAPLNLPFDRPRPPRQGFRGARKTFVLSKSLTERIKGLGRRENVTSFMTLLTAFQTLLYRCSGEEDIVVGSPSANRNNYDVENVIGCFVNSLAIRVQFSGGMSFRELLGRVRQSVLGAFAHQELPFEKLVEAIQPKRDLGHHPLFQVWFVLQNAPMPRLAATGLKLESLSVEQGTTRFDLELSMSEREQRFEGTLNYDIDLFDAGTIDVMLDYFLRLLEEVVTYPEAKLMDLLCSGSEYNDSAPSGPLFQQSSDTESQFAF